MYLAQATQQHEEAIHSLFCLPDVYRYLADGSPPPRIVAEDWIAQAPGDAAKHGGGLWLLSQSAPETEAPIGIVRLASDKATSLELTYVLHPDVWGKGLATRMAHTAIGYAFAYGKIQTIWAGADIPNTASIAVMKRLGMRFRSVVDYPMGDGVEYEITQDMYDLSTCEPIEIR